MLYYRNVQIGNDKKCVRFLSLILQVNFSFWHSFFNCPGSMQTPPHNNSPTKGNDVLANEIDGLPGIVQSRKKKPSKRTSKNIHKQRVDAAERK